MRIRTVHGPARAAGVPPGGELIAIDGQPVLDFIDYNWFNAQAELHLRVRAGAHTATYTLRKREEEDMGLELEGLYPPDRTCANRCTFCFVDQLPQGMRASLYVKDDDWRYSVLFGNYVSLSNVSEQEFARIVARRASPLYISVHATNGALRARLMGNPRAAGIAEQLARLAAGGIAMHSQVVLVPGHNDGAELARTLRDLWALRPAMRSVAVVPVGLTAHRQALAQLCGVSAQLARDTIAQVEAFAADCQRESGERFCFCSDELYERGGLPAPRYGGEHEFQLANGVGLVGNLLDGVEQALPDLPARLDAPRTVTCITGQSAAGLLRRVAQLVCERVGNLSITVLAARNYTFGESITVAGLLCGSDFIRAAQDFELGQALFIPSAALRTGEDVFLDGMTLGELAGALNRPVTPGSDDGYRLAMQLCGLEDTP